MTVDDKVWMIELIRGMRIDHTMLLLYPKFVFRAVVPCGVLFSHEIFQNHSCGPSRTSRPLGDYSDCQHCQSQLRQSFQHKGCVEALGSCRLYSPTQSLLCFQAYLIDNGIVLFLWIGLGVAEAWVQDIFGVNNVTMLDTENVRCFCCFPPKHFYEVERS